MAVVWSHVKHLLPPVPLLSTGVRRWPTARADASLRAERFPQEEEHAALTHADVENKWALQRHSSDVDVHENAVA